MSRASRDKGLRGEREVAGIFAGAGWTMRGLEGSGDWLAMSGRARSSIGPGVLHVEVKRQETLRVKEWLRQAQDEAPSGVPPLLVFRQSRSFWIAALPLTDLLGLIG